MCDSTSQEPAAAGFKGSPPLSRIGLNSHKAGMEGLDRDKINQIIIEASKGSKYYQNEVHKDEEITERVQHMLDSLKKLTVAQKVAAMKTVDKEVEVLELSRDLNRIIVHVDMDAFYAAVETRDRPDLKDRPMAVGSNSMLSTSNYVARRYGVRAAMPGFIAKKLCPNLVIVKPNYEQYHKTSQEVKAVLGQYDPNFCPVGLDESYLDITDFVKKMALQKSGGSKPSGTEIKDLSSPDSEDYTDEVWETESASILSKSNWLLAQQVVQNMRESIFKATGLTASAGIAPNKMLAKVASDRNKPNGQYFVEPTREEVLKFVQDLPIRKICGIGKVTEKLLNALGITLCRHLYDKRDILHLLFSQTTSNFFLAVSLGFGSVTVQRSNERKSMSVERSFSEIREVTEQMSKCHELCQILADDMENKGIKGRTVTIKLKTVDFAVKSRGVTVPKAVFKCAELYQLAAELLQQEVSASGGTLSLRLMGVRISTLQGFDSVGGGQRRLTSFLRPLDKPSTSQAALTKEDATDILNLMELTEYSTSPNLEVISPTLEATLEAVPLATCPLCAAQVSADNVIFNQHVDLCLNKTAIKEASGNSKSQQRLSLKRSQNCLSFYTIKRKKDNL